MNLIRKIAVVMVALGSVSVAQAELPDAGSATNVLIINGMVSDVITGTASIGDNFTASFFYNAETTMSGSPSFPEIGTYLDAILGATVTINDFTFEIYPESFPLNSINVYDNAPTAGDIDGYRFSFTESQPDGYYMRLVLTDYTQTLLDDFSLPSSLHTNMFDSGSFEFRSRNSSGHFYVYFQQISSLEIRSIAGPEPVTIDIKPGGHPNCFNINGHGVIPVAVLGSDSLDVIDVDISTLSFGGLALRMRGNKGAICGYEDSNDDGMQDLVCQFEDDPSAWSVGSNSATLSGELLDGSPFEGSDSICVVP